MTEQLEWIRAVVHEYERALILYAAGILGDRDRAHDVVQDAFMKLCTQDKERVEKRLKSWLFTVCRNRALDIRRKEKAMSHFGGESAMGYASPDPTPPAALEQRESASRVLLLLDALPARQREAVRLKFQHGLSYREIGAVMNASVANVGVLIHTGIKTLRSKLALNPV